jgi:hypothetical protein
MPDVNDKPWTPEHLPHKEWVKTGVACCEWKLESGHRFVVYLDNDNQWKVWLTTPDNMYSIRPDKAVSTFDEAIRQCSDMFNKFYLQGYY